MVLCSGIIPDGALRVMRSAEDQTGVMQGKYSTHFTISQTLGIYILY